MWLAVVKYNKYSAGGEGMNKRRNENELVAFSSVFVPAFTLIIALYLLSSSLVCSYSLTYDSYLGEIVGLQRDNPFLAFILVIICCCLMYLFNMECARIKQKILISVMLCWTLVLGYGFVYSASRIPAGDAEIVAGAAFQMAKGNVNGMNEYFSKYPFRLGLAFFEELCFRVLMLLAPDISRGYCVMALQVLNVILLAVCFYALTRISFLLFESERCEKITALLLTLYTPVILSCNSLSGRIPAICFSLISIWAYLCYRKNKSIDSALICVGAMGIAQCLKLDSLIILVALIVIMLLEAVSGAGWKRIWLMLFTLAFSLLMIFAPVALYDIRYESDLIGADVTLYSAMGLGEEEDTYLHYDGLYSAMSFGSGGDEESQIENTPFSWLAVQEQWNEPSFRTLYNNRDSMHYRETGFLYQLICYDVEWLALAQMNLHQNMLLLGFIAGLLALVKKRGTVRMMPALCVLGGFLFHLLFQARSQHAMRYYLMMVPMAAYGFEYMFLSYDNKNKSLKSEE